MHQLIGIMFLALLSFKIFATDSIVVLDDEREGIECEEAPTPGTNPSALGDCVAITVGGAGIIVMILGGVGTGLTCPEANAFDAARLICGFSIAGLAVGGVSLVGAIGGGLVMLLNKSPSETEEQPQC